LHVLSATHARSSRAPLDRDAIVAGSMRSRLINERIKHKPPAADGTERLMSCWLNPWGVMCSTRRRTNQVTAAIGTDASRIRPIFRSTGRELRPPKSRIAKYSISPEPTKCATDRDAAREYSLNSGNSAALPTMNTADTTRELQKGALVSQR